MPVTNEELKRIRVGEVSYTKYGTPAKIVEYHNSKKVLVEFQDDYKYRYYTSYYNFIHDSIINPYDKNIYNTGFIGYGKYNSKHPAYPVWHNMIRRCYYEKRSYDIMSYKDCCVDEEWHNFQNFAEWFEKNWYECNEKLVLDKDVKQHGNKNYSKNNCMLLPEKLNLLFVKESGRRGNLPIGVYFSTNANCYIAECSKDGKPQYLGCYTNVEDAFLKYKHFKENYIKELLEEKYKDILPIDVYNAVYKYEIDIND